jgi:hypothetical protein
MDVLDDILSRLSGIPEADKALLRDRAAQELANNCFLPNPGPQTKALLTEANLLLYGGAAGGGKSALLSGLALGYHERSLLMRRKGVDLMGGGGLIEETLTMYGSRNGYNGGQPPTLRTVDLENQRIITFGSALNIGDEQSFQGRARDLLGIDEATQFVETQIRFLMGWVRTTTPGQRTRTVLATNPPIDPTGDYIIGMFRPWLDLTHENPAQPGELRWYAVMPDGTEVEVEDATPIQIGDRIIKPSSRTFIPARLSDNPYLRDSGYDTTLDAMPEPLRSAMRDGNFMLARKDQANQIIPSQWILEAQNRWKPDVPDTPMTALSVDVAQGGADNTIVSPLYDAWFGEQLVVPGVETPDGASVAGLVIAKRRNGCHVTVDAGGGYGGSAIERLQENGVAVVPFKGAEGTQLRTNDNLLGFTNVRTAALWKIREALDPDQDGGSRVALPPDPMLLADLSAPTFTVMSNQIKALSKVDVVKMLGRSPDRGDGIMMVWFRAPKLVTHGQKWRGYNEEHARKSAGNVKVVMSRPQARRRPR